jgi:hypothetical protein
VPEPVLNQLLDRWRSAERRLSMRDPDATDYEDISREADRLRLEYQRVTLGGVAVGDQLQAAARETRRRLSRTIEPSADARELLRRPSGNRVEPNPAG